MNNDRAGEILIYQTEDGLTEVQLRPYEGTVWLSQVEIAELFQKARHTITEHIQNIFTEGELEAESVCRNFRHTAADGKIYTIQCYNLDLILAVGYRVRSARGTQFRRWATTTLKEYLIKGFVLNDERLKNPGPEGWDYFDSLLERIRDIRSSEKRFYQKVRDIYATSVDYDSKSEEAQIFFKTVQNKMLWAITGKTAAELIVGRANASLPNMGLTSWQKHHVRKIDIITAKNYLDYEELTELNRIVTMFLDFAEDQARRRQGMTMKKWEERLDAFLNFNQRPILNHSGSISHEEAEKLAHERFDLFDKKRQEAEVFEAEKEYLQELEALEKNKL